MDRYPPDAGPWVYLVPLAVIGLVILRNARGRRLRVEMLWVVPLMLLVLAGLMLVSQGTPRPVGLALDLAALGVGAVIGWWRGRLTNITVDPETHALTSRASPIGMLLILGVFAIRYALRSYGAETAGLLHMSVMEITDGLVLLAVGIVCAQRIEMAIRANRLLAEARAA